MTDFMLTTYDNKINPFTDFIAWFKEDLRLGHNCCQFLANEAETSILFSEKKNEEETINAMNRIVERFPFIYRKVRREDYEV